MALEDKKSILLTFDVEDWFQVENFKEYIPFSSWSSFDLRVKKNTCKILDLLDSFSFKPKATFFILGWVAERLPDLVRKIHSRGHEIASHGINHHLSTLLAPEDLLTDLRDSRKILEDITGAPIYGYRAPSFVINNEILKIIQKAGYLYDSSYNSFSMHGRYGSIDLGEEKAASVYGFFNDFYEVPITNISFFKKVFPLGGGGYFRLMPFFLFKQAMQYILKSKGTFVFYSHPWEFDPEQPRVTQASKMFKFRHYINLDQNLNKLCRLITSFNKIKHVSICSYLKDNAVQVRQTKTILQSNVI